MLTSDDVAQALSRVGERVRQTPVLACSPHDLTPHDRSPNDAVGLPGAYRLWFKLELLQHTGSFKARGAFNRVLAARERGDLDPSVGVVVASGGNAGLANAFAARSVDVPATVFVPETAPAVKVAKLRSLGADVRLVGREYAEAYEAAVAHAEATGAVYCHAYDQPEVAAGAGTLGLELVGQVPGNLDTVLVAVGGGGLLAGVAAALEGGPRVVGVEPERAPTLHAALAAGQPVDVDVAGVAADSLGARRVGDIAFEVAVRARAGSVLVSDDDIVAARQLLWSRWRIAVEHGAATALAALTAGAYRPGPDENVAVVLCGGNTDLSTLR
ncbi:MAG: threonine/serine dehydratase [Actinomycetes bacterium]